MTAPREFEVTRSASRVANRRGLILIVGLIIPLLVSLMPFYIDFSGIINVAEIYRKLEGPGALFPFIALTAVFLTMRSIRDKPSTIRLVEGGIRPAWASRKLFVLEGRPCVYPWVPASADTAHGACVELWCGRRSFIVGARGVSKVDLVIDAPPKRGLDCEVSRDVFFKILEGLFGTLPDPGAATPYHDICLEATSARIFRGIKDARLWLIAAGALGVILPIFIDINIEPKWQWVPVLIVLGGLGFFVKLTMTPKRLAHVLRISENGLEYRDADGRLLADAPFSQIEAAKLSYRNFSILRPVWVRHFPVLKVSFAGKTLLLSCPYIGESWRKTANQSGPPQYDITAYDWDKLLSALSLQHQAESRDA